MIKGQRSGRKWHITGLFSSSLRSPFQSAFTSPPPTGPLAPPAGAGRCTIPAVRGKIRAMPPRTRTGLGVIRAIRRTTSTGLGIVVATALAGAGVLAAAAPAHAEAYRYWGYRHLTNGTWVAADTGPADVTPSHGDVEGWRYAISGESTGQRVPRATPTFEEICGSRSAPDGRKLVGLVLDFGLAEEAPNDATPPPARAECVEVVEEATSAQIVASVASVRQEDGLICGLDGYPATGCGDPVAEEPKVPSPEPTIDLALPGDGSGEKDSASDDAANNGGPNDGGRDAARPGDARTDGTSKAAADDAGQDDGTALLWPLAGVAAILVLVLGAVWQHRRRGDANPQG